MTIGETLYVHRRADWRDWLQAHHATAREIWLVAYKKATGRPSLPYGDAVEEALCVGWIDSVRKTLDAERTAHRFTPRKRRGGYSQPNQERLARLLAAGQVHPAVAASLTDLDVEAFVYPEDILDALCAVPAAWAFFEQCPAPYRRIRVAFLESVRHSRPNDFAKRLQNLVAKCEAGTYFGYGIESFYGT